MLKIDLNCDVGEGFSSDELIMPLISSANIACGLHAGDKSIMKKTAELALKYKVSIGAHPSYPDRENFGRVDMLNTEIYTDEIPELILEQLIALERICIDIGTQLHHVKLHGALYNRAAKDFDLSLVICRALFEYNPNLILYGLSGSQMKKAADVCNLKFAHETFSDRTYQDDGSLTPRTNSKALIDDPAVAVNQAIQMITSGEVVSLSGKKIHLKADTICVHGDSGFANVLAVQLTRALKENNILVETFN
ncbi:MAG: LamB/YcsF family protein [Bacteroidetes bacterium]|nr:MAG: LamB/YcsF family protein [Bacteroidota bacterium]